MDYAELHPGHLFSPARIDLSRAAVVAYREAVDDSSPLYVEEDLVPPMAVAAFLLGELLRQMGLEPGTVHAGQEFTFHHELQIGQVLSFEARITQNSVRGSWRFLSIDLSASNEVGLLSVEGKSLVMFAMEAV